MFPFKPFLVMVGSLLVCMAPVILAVTYLSYGSTMIGVAFAVLAAGAFGVTLYSIQMVLSS